VVSEESTTPDLVEFMRRAFEAANRRDVDVILSLERCAPSPCKQEVAGSIPAGSIDGIPADGSLMCPRPLPTAVRGLRRRYRSPRVGLVAGVACRDAGSLRGGLARSLAGTVVPANHTRWLLIRFFSIQARSH
jgi:hypothetical protein